jgi:DNA-binding transcriptional MocR family regulator
VSCSTKATFISPQASTLHVSGLSQVVLLTLLKSWGEEGFKRHIAMVQVIQYY